MIGAAQVGAVIAWASQRWGALSGGRGGDRLTVEDVALLCQDMDPTAWHALVWVYANPPWQDESRIVVWAYLLERTADLATREQWRAPPGTLQALVRVALRDLRDEYRAANGHGHLARARDAGIDPGAWTRRWRARYEAVFQLAQRLLGEAQLHLRRVCAEQEVD